MEEDHVRLYISIPVSHPIPSVVQRLKGRTSKVIWEEYSKYLRQFYWKAHNLWAVGYFCATV
jgi:putative transposase